jgi:undecaprenyl phosphate N,N'-diacetylbacillosamine 1-phosphate transferase
MPQRAVDVGLSLIALGIFAPVQAVAAVLIRREDGGPVLFVQERVGRARRPFRIYKLRTMREGRVTRVGRWLRATGLDETGQFFNVLLGDMSIVGPRPLTAADIARLGWDRREHDARFAVRPGITGLVQVLGGTSARRSRALDALYARRRSDTLDLSLIAVSFAMNALGKERVRELLSFARRARLARRKRRFAARR